MRCSICDKSDVNLSNYLPEGGYAKDFYQDPTNKLLYICGDCAESYIELMNDYYQDDVEDTIYEKEIGVVNHG